MKGESILSLDPRMPAALEGLEAAIRQHYPEARFRVSRGEDDPAIVQLITIVDVEDTDPVLDVVMEQMLALQAEELPIFVVTERPPERTMAMLEAARAKKPAGISTS
jgi:hypothetical protein